MGRRVSTRSLRDETSAPPPVRGRLGERGSPGLSLSPPQTTTGAGRPSLVHSLHPEALEGGAFVGSGTRRRRPSPSFDRPQGPVGEEVKGWRVRGRETSKVSTVRAGPPTKFACNVYCGSSNKTFGSLHFQTNQKPYSLSCQVSP